MAGGAGAGLVLGEGARKRLARAAGGAAGAAEAPAWAEGRLWGTGEAAWADSFGADRGAAALASADALRTLGAPSGARAWATAAGGGGSAGRPILLQHCPRLDAAPGAVVPGGAQLGAMPALWFSTELAQNLGLRPALLRSFPARRLPRLKVRLLPEGGEGTRGPRAVAVRLAKVLEPSRRLLPDYASAASTGGRGAASLVRLEAAVREHFAAPHQRWVSPGDLLELPLPGPGPAASACFRVEVVEQEDFVEGEGSGGSGLSPFSKEGGGWVDGNDCRLELCGVVASPVPPPEATEGIAPLGRLARAVLGAAAPSFFVPPWAETAGGAPAALLLHGPGERTAAGAVWDAAEALGVGVVEFCCYELAEGAAAEGGGDVAAALAAAAESAARFAPAVLLLRRFEALGGDSAAEGPNSTQEPLLLPLRALRKAATAAAADRAARRNSSGYYPLVLLAATAASAEEVPGGCRRHFTHEIEVLLPDEGERVEALRATGVFRSGERGVAEDGDLQGHSFSLKRLARETPGASADDLAHFAADVAHRAMSDAGSGPGSVDVTDEQVVAALAGLRDRSSQVIGAPKVPNVGWGDVGGLEDVKEAIVDTFDLPLRHPELFSSGLQLRSGVLLYGPPGTGKTLLAKAVATECTLNFLSVKGPELISMYIGESERNVRDVFRRARQAAPSVIFFDELDALAPARGRAGDSGGVMDRVVSQFLAELDDVQGSAGEGNVFVIGATNRPDLIDPSLLRPGRFDTTLYVGIASDGASRVSVLAALTRRFELAPDADLAAVAARCPKHLTGADLYALCADAWMNGAKRTVAARGPGGAGEGPPGDARVLVSAADFSGALEQLTPSLSLEELARYERIRDSYRNKS